MVIKADYKASMCVASLSRNWPHKCSVAKDRENKHNDKRQHHPAQLSRAGPMGTPISELTKPPPVPCHADPARDGLDGCRAHQSVCFPSSLSRQWQVSLSTFPGPALCTSGTVCPLQTRGHFIMQQCCSEAFFAVQYFCLLAGIHQHLLQQPGHALSCPGQGHAPG